MTATAKFQPPAYSIHGGNLEEQAKHNFGVLKKRTDADFLKPEMEAWGLKSNIRANYTYPHYIKGYILKTRSKKEETCEDGDCKIETEIND